MNENFQEEFYKKELYKEEDKPSKVIKYAGIGLLGVIAVCAGIVFGFGGFNAASDIPNAIANAVNQENSENSAAANGEALFQNEVTAETRMVYEYYFPSNNSTDYITASAPDSLIGSSEGGLKKLMSGWEVVKFSPEEIVARKTVITDNSQSYMLGIKDGYIAVFYDDEIHGLLLKEVTETPVAGLNQYEIARLEKGVYIYGAENLISALQDYGS